MSNSERELIALLDFYAASGVDLALDETVHNRFEEGRSTQAAEPRRHQDGPQARSEKPSTQSPPANRSTSPMPVDEAVMAARMIAAEAKTLEELRQVVERFDGCSLRQSARHLVFADGPADARLMLIGEAPGREEDRLGKPFVGRSGQLLDKMLAAIELDREAVYITNTLPWRPPGNRTPSPIEQEICAPFIKRQIELVAPDILVFLGAAAAKMLTGRSEGILKLRGRWLDYQVSETAIPALATLHPAYLLRQPIQKRLAWQDFMLIRKRMADKQS